MSYKVLDTYFKWMVENTVLLDDRLRGAEVRSNEAIIPEPVHRIMDTVYEKDEKYYNIEYQTGKLTEEDLRRFHFYHLCLIEKHQTKNVYSIIIYTEKADEDAYYRNEQTCFKPEIISLKNLDGDKILNNIKIKIKNNEKLTLEEEVDLSALPLYQTKRDPKDLLMEVCKLANKIKDKIEQKNLDNIKNGQLLIVDKIVPDNEEKQKYLEEIKMHSEALDILIQQGKQEGIEQGMEKGILKGKQEGSRDTKIDLTRNMLKSNIPINKIAEITGLSKKEIENIRD